MADIRGYTPLHLATDDYAAVGPRGFDTGFEILSELLKSEEAEDKETLDYQDQWGRTALMHAAGKHIAWNDGSQVDANRRPIALAIRLLLKKGASVSVVDNPRQNALHHFEGRRAQNLKERGMLYDGIPTL